MIVRTILVDDEIDALEILERDLLQHCANVQVLERCQSANKALEAIRATQPDLILLDIEMPGLSGMEIARTLHQNRQKTAVIFVTAYRLYAPEAFEVQAVDYLLKPVEPDKLKQALQKYTCYTMERQLASLRQKMDRPSHLRIPGQNGFELLLADQILYCEADGGITKIYMADGKRGVAGRNLGFYESVLGDRHFFRTHHKYLVNLDFVQKYNSRDHTIELSSGAFLPVSQQKLRDFLFRIEEFAV